MKKGYRIGFCLVLLVLALEGGVLYWVNHQGALDPMPPGTSEATQPQMETTAEPTTEATTEMTEAPTTLPPVDLVQEYLDTMTLREKVGQMLMVSPTQLPEDGLPVGGILCFSGDLETREQVIEMINSLQESAKTGLFIAVDEEGGTVSRLGNHPDMGVTSFSNMGYVSDREEAYQVGSTLGREIAELGFNLDFAPVADVNSNPDNPIIGTRAFRSDPEEAAELVAACVDGFRDSGMLCTLKHFPGHGDTETDTHLGQAVTYKDLEELRDCEFLPFASGIAAGAEFVMVAHIAVPEVTGDDLPSSLSRPIVTDLLREELGFRGIVITDAMNMGAISDRFSSGEAAVQAVQAGVDLVLMPVSPENALEGILTAVENGEIPESRIDESVYRILSVKLEKGLI